MTTSYQITLEDGYIMVVEDSHVEAIMLRQFLESNKLKIESFDNATDALNFAKTNLPTLIVSDIMMPGLSGYEFCSLIKADPVLKEVPVILLTALGDPLDIINGLQAGADNFITKPYDQQYLLSRIHYLLANRDMRKAGAAEMILEVMFLGQKYTINSEKKQILDLLLSVYEDAVKKQDELVIVQSRLHALNEELIQKNDELEAFAYTVSHDLRNPLHAIKGFSEMLEEEFNDVLPEEGRQYLSMIQTASDSMGQIIEDLLEFSKSGRGDIDRKDTNLSEIAIAIMDDLQFRQPGRAATITVAPELRVFADPHLMHLVLSNLLGNAWKYTSKKELTEISLGKTGENQKAVFFVRDNGTGFDNSMAEVIFNPFERLHSSEDYPGTGVGLSSVKRIIERHGGRVWAESVPGEGSTFYFSIA
ncbi:MAG: response regulator [Bacteroidales bacterium]